jgi:hypothetical protein
MSFDKKYPRRKDDRKEYRGSKSFDKSCRNHGNCSYCQNNRIYSTVKRKESINDKLNDYEEL